MDTLGRGQNPGSPARPGAPEPQIKIAFPASLLMGSPPPSPPLDTGRLAGSPDAVRMLAALAARGRS